MSFLCCLWFDESPFFAWLDIGNECTSCVALSIFDIICQKIQTKQQSLEVGNSFNGDRERAIWVLPKRLAGEIC